MKRICMIFIGVVLGVGCITEHPASGAWWDKAADLVQSVGTTGDASPAGPNLSELTQAFKEALRIGSGNVVQQLGAVEGFNGDPSVHIPLPDQLQSVKTVLSKVGMGQMVDDLELKLNRAAEAAAPKAKDLFYGAIQEMTFDDVQKIYKGPENAATLYFKEKMSPGLTHEMKPVVEQTLAEVGVVQAYDTVLGQYKTLPFVPDVKADLTDHVLTKGLDGIFYYMAQEEAAIRKDPVRQTTTLLKKVFGKM